MATTLHKHPYKAVLSQLRKIDLLRLSAEFKLSTEGSVTVLRDRLKDYLNAHRDALFRNPRYNVLFPKRRLILRPPVPRTPPPRNSPRPSTPTLPSNPPSPARSYESWHGIQDQDLAPFEHHNVYQPPSPSTPSSDSSDHESIHNSPPPQFPVPNERKYYLAYSIIFLSSIVIRALCSSHKISRTLWSSDLQGHIIILF